MSTPLQVILSARLDQFERDMAQAGKLAEEAVSNINDQFAKANPSLGGFALNAGVIAASVAGVLGIVDAAVKGNAALAEMARTAKELGVSLDRLQSIQFAAQLQGLDTEKFNDGLRKMVSLLGDAQTHENSLSKLYEANGLKIKDNNGNLIDTNKLLENAVTLISKAQPRDQADFAKMLGLTREWVPLIDKSATAFEKSAASAKDAGAIIDSSIIEKAKIFDDEWRKSSVAFTANIKAGLSELLPYFNDLIRKAADFVRAFDLGDKITQASDKLLGASIAFNLPTKPTDAYFKALSPDEAKQFLDYIDRKGIEIDATWRGIMQSTIEAAKAITQAADVPLPQARPNVPTATPDGGFTKRPVDTTTTTKDAFDRAIESTQRRTAVIDAETVSIGKNTFETQRNIASAQLIEALNRAGIIITPQLNDKIKATAEAYGAAAERARAAQYAFQGINNAARFFGDQLTTALDGLLNRTTTFQQAFTTILRSIQTELLRAAITGQGALAQLFGTASTITGGTGGLAGLLTSFAKLPTNAGGTSNWSGGPTWVGENGPEIVIPPSGSQIVPNALSMRGGGGVGDITVRLEMDLTGVNGEESMARIARASAAQAVREAVSIANAGAPARSLKYAQLGT